MDRPFYAEDENGVLRRWYPPALIADGETRRVLINLIAGMHLCDHMGDVTQASTEAAAQAGLITAEEKRSVADLRELGELLARKHGATTIWGSEV